MGEILHLLWSGSVGGIENLCLNIGRTEPKENLFCFVHKGGTIAEQMKTEGLSAEILRLKKWDIMALYRYLSLKIKDNEIVCIIVHHDSELLWLVSGFLKGIHSEIKVYLYAHCSYEDFIQNKKDRFIFSFSAKQADGVIAISEYVRKSIVEHFPSLQEKVYVVYNGIDLIKFSPCKKTMPEDGRIRLIYVGRLIKQKGIQLLLSSIATDSLMKKVSLTIVGDGPFRKELENLCSDLRLNKIVYFVGNQDDVVSYLKESDIFVHPAIWEEGFGISIIEAMAMGVPCIAFNKGAIPEIITDGVDGFIVRNVSEEALRNKIADICSTVDTEFWNNVCVEAEKKAGYFSVSQTIDGLRSLIINKN